MEPALGVMLAEPQAVITFGSLPGIVYLRRWKYFAQVCTVGQRPRYPSVKKVNADRETKVLAGRW